MFHYLLHIFDKATRKIIEKSTVICLIFFVSGPFRSKVYVPSDWKMYLYIYIYIYLFIYSHLSPRFYRVQHKKTAEAGCFPQMSQALAMAATFTEIQWCHLEVEVGVAQPKLHRKGVPLLA